MQIVLATDIFGYTSWIDGLVNDWRQQGHSIHVMSPYKTRCSFTEESEAYARFKEGGGVETYCHDIQLQLTSSIFQQQTLFIGFSAGGSALWKMLSKLEIEQNSHLIAFYPGQIRHYLNLMPNVSSSLVFPKLEQHFDLSAIIEYLVTKSELNVIQNSLLHGYANPNSEQYEPVASMELAELLGDIDLCITAKKLNKAMLGLSNEHQILSVG